MKLHEIVKQLRETSSTLGKQAILEKNRDNVALRNLFWMTENPHLNYYIKADVNVKSKGILELDEFILLDTKDTLHDRRLTGNDAREYVREMTESLTKEDGELYVKMINRDLDCKTGTGILNKVWKGLIPEMPCMLASKMDEKAVDRIVYKKHGYRVETKYDGGRAMAVVSRDGAVEFLSRNGKPLLMHGVFDSTLMPFRDYVFDGELIVTTETGVADRQTGNGFFTKAVRGTIKSEEAVKFHYVVWDVIPREDFFNGYSKLTLAQRLSTLLCFSKLFPDGRVTLSEGQFISSLEEANTFYQEMLARGEEGAILKFLDAPWEDKRSKFMIKLKEEKDIDAEVIDVIPHSKKVGWIGALRCKTRDGNVEFEVGSGFNDDDRQKDPSFYFGKIVQCKYNMLIQARNRSTYSLFLPVFQCVRFDKTEANSLEELK
jgi:hypothetical protein